MTDEQKGALGGLMLGLMVFAAFLLPKARSEPVSGYEYRALYYDYGNPAFKKEMMKRYQDCDQDLVVCMLNQESLAGWELAGVFDLPEIGRRVYYLKRRRDAQ
jgi:hypothetical protein